MYRLPLPSLRRDPVFASALVLLALAATWALLFDGRVPGVPSPDLSRSLGLAAALLAVAFRPARESARTRGFWRLIAFGLAFFLLAQLWDLEARPLLLPSLARRSELLYLGRYLFLVMALEMRPDAPRPGRSEDQLRLLDTAGAVLFLFALILYVLVSPPLPGGAPRPAVSLRALHLVLDVFLVARAFTLGLHTTTTYWRSVYRWLGVVFALRGLTNLFNAAPSAGGLAPLGVTLPGGASWFIVLVPLIVAARLTPDPEHTSPPDELARAGGRLAPLVGYAFTFPIFHFLMERVGIVDHDPAGARETVVLAFLAGAAFLLWIYQRVLIRENHRLEDERRLITEQAEDSRRLEGLGRLAGGVAHDFNNLLTVIRGRTELMLAEHPTADGLKEDLEAIRQATRRGEGVTRQLLAFGRRQILRSEVLDLGGVVNEMAPLLRSAVSAEVRLSVTIKDPAPLIVADQAQVEMALLNLAVNAREAMPGGGLLALSVERVELDAAAAADIAEAQPGSYVLLTVQDTGKGMDEATLERVFEPFYTTKPFGSGAGLGLPAVHGFVKQSGGALTVTSAPGRGATFRIYLPRVDAAAAPRIQEESTIAAARS